MENNKKDIILEMIKHQVYGMIILTRRANIETIQYFWLLMIQLFTIHMLASV